MRVSNNSMQRDPCAYLNDILEAAAAINEATAAIDESSYIGSRLIRSAVEWASPDSVDRSLRVLP